MRPALIGSVGVVKAAAGGASAPATPTIVTMADTTAGQSADFAFSTTNLNGSSLTLVEVRWSAVVGEVMPTTLSYSGNWRPGGPSGSPLTATGSVTAGTNWYTTTGAMTGTKQSDDVAAYYQCRLTNASGASAWSSVYGPVTTTFVP